MNPHHEENRKPTELNIFQFCLTSLQNKIFEKSKPVFFIRDKIAVKCVAEFSCNF